MLTASELLVREPLPLHRVHEARVALEIAALARRRQTPKGATDLADLRRLLLAHPELRDAKVDGVIDRIGGGAEAKQAWAALLAEPLVADDSNEGY